MGRAMDRRALILIGERCMNFLYPRPDPVKLGACVGTTLAELGIHISEIFLPPEPVAEDNIGWGE